MPGILGLFRGRKRKGDLRVCTLYVACDVGKDGHSGSPVAWGLLASVTPCLIGLIAWPSHLPGIAAPSRWIHRVICQLYLDTFYSCFFSSWRDDCSISTIILRFSFDVSIQHVKLSRAVPANLFTTGVFLPCKLILHY